MNRKIEGLAAATMIKMSIIKPYKNKGKIAAKTISSLKVTWNQDLIYERPIVTSVWLISTKMPAVFPSRKPL
ncbi:MAG TPA: hypothetical protein VM571_00940 [Noviherbaspirillum sp.]|nr:hypothetical protein [Noviherbaspirillum sp.]